MLASLTDLHLITGKPDYLDYASKLHDAFAANVQRVVVAHASFLSAFEQHAMPVQAVLVGPPSQTIELRQAVLQHYPALLLYVQEETALPPDHIAHGKTMADGKPTLYLCTGQTCSLPITDPDQVSKSSV